MASQEERDRIMAEYMAAQAEDDEDESEAEFAPGDSDDDDDDDVPFEGDDDDQDEDYTILQGTLARRDGKLIYKGHVLTEKFELASKESGLHWSVAHPTKTSVEETNPSHMRTIEMEGNMGKQNVAVDLTLTAQEKNESVAGKKGGDEDEEDGKKPAASPSKPQNVCTVYGKGKDDSGSFEFYGEFDPSTAEHHIISLECKKRTVSAAPPAAAAAAAAAPPPVDDDDDVDDADEGMDHNELIALHEDAGMSVEDLRKRYQSAGAGNDEDDAKPPAKRAKTQPEPDDDDDDEYGF